MFRDQVNPEEEWVATEKSFYHRCESGEKGLLDPRKLHAHCLNCGKEDTELQLENALELEEPTLLN